ncbi:MAG TPA: tetratricopeptide repeat protein [Terriglobia bacterium]|nr:tetratricopeptide repeat protein [Terriglobia bacterium]
MDSALDLYRKALNLNRDWASGWQNLGLLQADRADFQAARSAFENLVRCQPTQGDGWALLGISEFRLQQYNPALNHFVKARSLPFRSADLHQSSEYHFALVLILRQDFDSAQKILGWLYRRGMKTGGLTESCGLAAMRIPALPGQSDPATLQVVNETGQVVLLGFDRKPEQARAQFEQLTRAHPGLPGLRYAQGSFLAQEGLYDEAYSAFLEGLEISPKDPFFHLQLAAVEIQRNHPQDALHFARRATELAPDLFAGHLIEGKILLQQSNIDDAITKLELAAKLAPESPQVHVALLNAYVRAKRTSDVAREKMILKKLDDIQTAAVAGELPGVGGGQTGEHPDAEAPEQ